MFLEEILIKFRQEHFIKLISSSSITEKLSVKSSSIILPSIKYGGEYQSIIDRSGNNRLKRGGQLEAVHAADTPAVGHGIQIATRIPLRPYHGRESRSGTPLCRRMPSRLERCYDFLKQMNHI